MAAFGIWTNNNAVWETATQGVWTNNGAVNETAGGASGTIIEPARVDLSFSSFAPNFNVDLTNQTISPARGDLVFTSSAPSFSISDNLLISVSSKDLVFSSFSLDLGISDNQFISIPSKDLAFSTFILQELTNHIAIDSGDLVFTTYAPDVGFSYVVVIPAGNLRFTSSVFDLGFLHNIRRVNLTLSTYAPIFEVFDNRNVSQFITPRSPIAAVEMDLYDGENEEIKTLRVWSGDEFGNGLTRVVGLEKEEQFDPRLYIPIQIGREINSQEYGQPLRGLTTQGGVIEFVNSSDIWSWLGYHWAGRTFRLYEGQSGDVFEDMFLVNIGRIDDLNFDEQKISMKIIDTSLDLDVPLVNDFYPDDAIVSLLGRPKPYLRGEVYSVEPVLEDDPTQSYRLSNTSLTEIMEIRVGGIVWDEYTGINATPPAGMWKGDLPNGTFLLGSETLGQEVRCDVRNGTYSTIDLITEIVEESNLEVDQIVLKACNNASPGPIGFYTVDPINKLDVLDALAFGAGALWEFELNGKIRVRAIEAPDASLDFRHSPMVELTEINIVSLNLIQIVPPAFRISVEYKRNWMPLTNILPGVSDEDKARFTQTGILAEVFEDDGIKVLEPRAVDVAVIRTLFVNESDAVFVRDRLSRAWGVERRLYEVVCWVDQIPELYDTLYVDFQMIRGYFRIHSVLGSVGGGSTTLIVWGENNVINLTSDLSHDTQHAIVITPGDSAWGESSNTKNLRFITYAPNVIINSFIVYFELTYLGFNGPLESRAAMGFTTDAFDIAAANILDNDLSTVVNSAGSLSYTGNATGLAALTYPNNPSALAGNSGETIGYVIDTVRRLKWTRNTNNPTLWNNNGSADPSTGVGGFDFSGDVPSGNIFIMGGTSKEATLGNQTTPPFASVTLNAGVTSFAATLPDNVNAWDTTGATTWNPDDNSGLVLSNGNLTLTGSNNPTGGHVYYFVRSTTSR